MRVAIYLRCAYGEKQRFDSQRAECVEYTRLEGLEVAQIYEDYIESGLQFDRPALQQMLEDAKAGLMDGVVVRDLARLSRADNQMAQIILDFIHLVDEKKATGYAEDVPITTKEIPCLSCQPRLWRC